LGGIPPGPGGMFGGGKGGIPCGMLGAVYLLVWHCVGQDRLDLRPPRPMNGGGMPGIPIHSQQPPPWSSRPSSRTWRRKSRHSPHRRHAHRRPSHAHAHSHSTHRSTRKASAQVCLVKRIRLTFRVVRVRYAVDDLLCLVARYLLVVCLHIAEMVATVVVGLAHAHAVVRKVYIAVIAEELGHYGGVTVQRGGQRIGTRRLVLSSASQGEALSSRISRSESWTADGLALLHHDYSSRHMSCLAERSTRIRCANMQNLPRYRLPIPLGPHLPRSQRSRSANLPPSSKVDAAELVLIVAAHVAVLIDVPALALARASSRILGCGLDRPLRLLPFLLALTFTLHLAFEQGLGSPAKSLCLGL
jgi:hypothetical protein